MKLGPDIKSDNSQGSDHEVEAHLSCTKSKECIEDMWRKIWKLKACSDGSSRPHFTKTTKDNWPHLLLVLAIS